MQNTILADKATIYEDKPVDTDNVTIQIQIKVDPNLYH